MAMWFSPVRVMSDVYRPVRMNETYPHVTLRGLKPNLIIPYLFLVLIIEIGLCIDVRKNSVYMFY